MKRFKILLKILCLGGLVTLNFSTTAKAHHSCNTVSIACNDSGNSAGCCTIVIEVNQGGGQGWSPGYCNMYDSQYVPCGEPDGAFQYIIGSCTSTSGGGGEPRDPGPPTD